MNRRAFFRKATGFGAGLVAMVLLPKTAQPRSITGLDYLEGKTVKVWREFRFSTMRAFEIEPHMTATEVMARQKAADPPVMVETKFYKPLHDMTATEQRRCRGIAARNAGWT